MKPKSCSRCGSPAEFSICVLLSTIGKPGRQQKCTASIPYCNACLKGLIDELSTLTPPALSERVNTAFTAIVGHSQTQSEPIPHFQETP